MSRATAPSMQGSDESKKTAERFDYYKVGEGATGKDGRDTAKEKQDGHSQTCEGRERESSHKDSGRSSRAEARTDNVMMQRWLNEAPGDQPFSSVRYHAKNDKKLQ